MSDLRGNVGLPVPQFIAGDREAIGDDELWIAVLRMMRTAFWAAYRRGEVQGVSDHAMRLFCLGSLVQRCVETAGGKRYYARKYSSFPFDVDDNGVKYATYNPTDPDDVRPDWSLFRAMVRHWREVVQTLDPMSREHPGTLENQEKMRNAVSATNGSD